MMLASLRTLIRRLAGDERGVILPLVTVALPVIFGTTALAIDYGYVRYVQSRLQATTDAAALAGAQGLSDGDSYTAEAQTYSSSASVGGINTIAGITVAAPTITPRCSSTMQSAAIPCTGSTSSPPVYNVISVTQTAQVPLIFGSAIGLKPMTVSATAHASAAPSPSSPPPPPPVASVRLIPAAAYND
jgi:uncharacterized membrane protein